jgi:hypothetical protein
MPPSLFFMYRLTDPSFSFMAAILPNDVAEELVALIQSGANQYGTPRLDTWSLSLRGFSIFDFLLTFL